MEHPPFITCVYTGLKFPSGLYDHPCGSVVYGRHEEGASTTPLDSIFNGSPSPHFPPWARGAAGAFLLPQCWSRKMENRKRPEAALFKLRSADSLPGMGQWCEYEDSWARLRPTHLGGCAWDGDGGWQGGLRGVPDEGERWEREDFGRAPLFLPKASFSRTAVWTLACGVSWLLLCERVKRCLLDAFCTPASPHHAIARWGRSSRPHRKAEDQDAEAETVGSQGIGVLSGGWEPWWVSLRRGPGDSPFIGWLKSPGTKQ